MCKHLVDEGIMERFDLMIGVGGHASTLPDFVTKVKSFVTTH
jgi:hypothetical protein